jgi:ribonucleoside-triphosphate reductase
MNDTTISTKDTVEEYVDGTDWRIQANSNTGYSHAGLINQSAGKVMANYWLDQVYNQDEGQAHRKGDLHIHDLDSLSGYCAGWSLRVLLDEGFNGVAGRNASKAPKHFAIALSQMANFLGILQSEWAGAQAFSSFDTYLAPLLFRDQLSYEVTKSLIETFIYNLNVPARWGQSPFTNVTIDWEVPKDLRDQIPTRNKEHVFTDILDNRDLLLKAQRRNPKIEKLTDMTYKDFQYEIDMIDQAYYEIMTKGDAHGNPFTFPIPTVNITEDFNFDDKSPKAKALWENTSKIGSSYFQNFIGSQFITDAEGVRHRNPEAYSPDAVRSMCCRLQLDLRELLKRGGGLFGSAEMTGSIGVVTLNMARIGFQHKTKPELFEQIDKLCDIAYSTLEKKRIKVQDLYERGLFPYTKRYLHHFNNHFSTIGVNGINEMCQNFFSDRSKDITSPEGYKLSFEILEHIRDKMVKYQEESGNLYNLEATPAEGTTYRFAKEDYKVFGKDIIQAGTYPNIYYTNSSQLPAGYTEDPFEALEQQDDLQCKYTGGTVLHLYMDGQVKTPESCASLVKKTISNFKLPYVTVTPLFSVCPKHGYLSGEHEYCPECDKEIIEQQGCCK